MTLSFIERWLFVVLLSCMEELLSSIDVLVKRLENREQAYSSITRLKEHMDSFIIQAEGFKKLPPDAKVQPKIWDVVKRVEKDFEKSVGNLSFSCRLSCTCYPIRLKYAHSWQTYYQGQVELLQDFLQLE